MQTVLYGLLSLSLLFTGTSEAAIWYVDQSSVALEPDGAQWGTAYRDLQMAVDVAFNAGGGEVWVAEGTYTATAAQVLAMKDGVHLYGGFAGTEADRSQRNWILHETIVDGEGARRGVIGASAATLDGFTVTRGLAPADASYGGGMYNSSVSPAVCNCVFNDNTADYGGGMHIDLGSPTIASCMFIRNVARQGGAGILNGGSPTIIDSVFVENTALQGYGGGMSFFAGATLIDCEFLRNSAPSYGGGIFNANVTLSVAGCTFQQNSAMSGGGIGSFDSRLSMDQCIFIANSASGGGGLYSYSGRTFINASMFTGNSAGGGGGIATEDDSSLEVTNCAFTGNSSRGDGGAVYIDDAAAITNSSFSRNSADRSGGGVYSLMRSNMSKLAIRNCILRGDSSGQESEISNAYGIAEVSYSCVQDGFEGTGNINAAPLFVDEDGWGSLRLAAGSPCIDAGTEEGAPETDIFGLPRNQGTAVDMGAYESSDEEEEAVTLTVAVFPQGAGVTVPPVGDHVFARGEIVHLAASATGTLLFSHWEGLDNSLQNSVVMDSDRALTAVFVENIYYVDIDSPAASPDGRSWASAYRDLQSAVNAAAGDGRGEIWAAEGAYTGTFSYVLMMPDNVHLYGGFNGVETARTQRNWKAHPAIIDGENKRGGVLGADNIVLDGFEVTRSKSSWGGGFVSYSGVASIRNCVFHGNSADNGGAISGQEASSITISDSIFERNTAVYAGGAIWVWNSTRVTGCILRENVAESGGAIAIQEGQAEVTNCLMESNSAKSGGAIYGAFCSADIINCTITANVAQQGGAAYNLAIPPEMGKALTFTNCVFWGDSAAEGAEIYNKDANPAVTYSCVQGGYEGTGNIDADPLFVHAGSPGEIQLLEGSRCIDSGISAGAPTTDLMGRLRPQGFGFEMGAFEGAVARADAAMLTISVAPEGSGVTTPVPGQHYYLRDSTVAISARGAGAAGFSRWQGTIQDTHRFLSVTMDSDKDMTAVFANEVIYVKADSLTESPDGRTWDTAYPSLPPAAEDVAYDGYGEVWVARGTYTGTADEVLKMTEGVQYYGGFAGTETSREERDWFAHPTVINGEDTRRGVTGADDATLDGFTITNGRARGSYPNYCGGGLFCDNSSPTVSHCIFTNNYGWYGGGMFVYQSSPRVTNCWFTNNTARYGGGGLGTDACDEVRVINCAFAGNAAVRGGGLNNFGSWAKVINCTFTGNVADYGGGVYIQSDMDGYSNNTRVVITNCILWGDAMDDNQEVHLDGGTVSVSYSCVEDEQYARLSSNTADDPLFIDGIDGGDGFDLRLRAGSPCIDTGSSSLSFPDLGTDIIGTPRPQGVRSDMGAYECIESALVPNLLGLNQVEASEQIADARLVLGSQTYAFSSEVPLGHVMTQNPSPGSSALPDSAIDIVLSVGPARVLHTATTGDGSVDVWPEDERYITGALVTLTASPAEGWRFDRWAGDVSSAANPVIVIMAADRSVTAVFVRWSGEGEDLPTEIHSADQNADGAFDLSELLRAIQFYNLKGYQCSTVPGESEDGYLAGPGANHACGWHSCDYGPSDWQLSLTELLRIIQFYNSGGYIACPEQHTEDGYCVRPVVVEAQGE